MKVVVLRGITTKKQRFTPSLTDIPNVVDLDDDVVDIFVRGGAAREATDLDVRLSGYVDVTAEKPDTGKVQEPKAAATKPVASKQEAPKADAKADDPL